MVYVAVTASNATGETNPVRITPVAFNKAGNLEVRILGPVPNATQFHIYASRDRAPKLERTVNTSGLTYPHTVTLTGLAPSTGRTPVNRNQSEIIYSSLTTLPIWDRNPIVDEDGTATPVRRLMDWFDEVEQTRSFQQYRLVYRNVHFDLTQAPKVANAVNTASYEMPHLELRIRNRLNGQTMFIDMIEAAVGREIVIDCGKKRITRDAEGDPQADAIRLDTDRDQWMTLQPGVVNTIEYTVTQRAGAAAPSITGSVTIVERW